MEQQSIYFYLLRDCNTVKITHFAQKKNDLNINLQDHLTEEFPKTLIFYANPLAQSSTFPPLTPQSQSESGERKRFLELWFFLILILILFNTFIYCSTSSSTISKNSNILTSSPISKVDFPRLTTLINHKILSIRFGEIFRFVKA